MELVTACVGVIKNFGPDSAYPLVILLLGVYLTWHYAKVRYPEKVKEQREYRKSMERIEKEKNAEQKAANEYLRKASDRQDVLLNNTINTVSALNGTISTLNQTFEKVSDMLASHDQKSDDMMMEINHIRNTMPTKDTVKRLHSRIDDMQKTALSKEDVQTILAAISNVDDELSKASHMLSEIRMRQLS